MFYISYGSNINPIQMAHLCNTPVFIGTGILHDYDMDFYATTKDKNTANVYADVVKTMSPFVFFQALKEISVFSIFNL